MLELRKFVAPEFLFGAGSRKLVSQYVSNFGGRKALVVTDAGVMAAGWTKDVTDCLEEAGIKFAVYSNVLPNPRDSEVEAGARFYREQECDVIVAIGGGSPMDCAKGICIVVANNRPIGDFEGVDNVDIPGPPLICIPTTSGTAADLSQFAIITAPAEKRKFAIISKKVVPDVSLIDPETNTTMDHHLTACTGMDSLVHAIEAFVSSANSPITDNHALTAIELLRENLPLVLQNPDDVTMRGKVTLGCLHAGLAFSNASLGAVHAMAHSLGGFLDLPHGECNAILLRHVMGFNSSIVPERYGIIGDKLGLDLRGMTEKNRCQSVLAEITRMTHAVGIKDTLTDKGVKTADVIDLADKAVIDPCIITNPRRANKRDLEVIYEEAL